MPRNASGVYSLPESAFVAGTIIESAKVNNDFSDIATALTQSLATTGVSSMSGQFKAAAGAVGAPGIVFAGSLTTGFYRSAADEISWAAAGTQRGVFGATGNVTFSGNLAVGGTFTVTGAITFTGALSVGGAITGSSDLFITGSASIGSNLGVAGSVSLSADLHVAGTASLAGNLFVAGSVKGGLVVTASVSIGGDLYVTGLVPGRLIAIIEDITATGAAAQLLASGANIRTLNTLSFNYNNLVALSANSFDLPPGSFEISWFAPTDTQNTGGNHKSMLFQVTSSVSIKWGTGGHVDIGDTDAGDTTFSIGSTVVSVAATATYQILHFMENNNVLRGGETTSLGPEIYARVEVRAA